MKALKKSLLVLGLALTAPLYAQTVNYTTLNWPPFIGEEEDRHGVLAEIVKQSMAEVGNDYTLTFTSWTEALEQALSGQKDAVIGAYYSEERAEKYYYSLPLYRVYTGVIKLDSSGINLKLISSFDELDDYLIGKLADSVVGESFDEHPFPNMKTYATEAEAVKALYAGEIELYAGNLDVARALAKKQGKDSNQLSLIPPPVSENDLFVMFSKKLDNAEELRDSLNQGLIKLQSSGKYDEIVASFQ